MTYILLVPYFIIVFYIIIRGLLSQRSINKKIVLSLVIILVSIIPPWWDEITGQIYFKYLCEKYDGIKIYEKYDLGSDFWAKYKNSQLTELGKLDEELLDYRFATKTIRDETYSNIFNISVSEEHIVDVTRNKVLGTDTRFHFNNGWVVKYSGFYNVGQSCNKPFKNLINEIFIKPR